MPTFPAGVRGSKNSDTAPPQASEPPFPTQYDFPLNAADQRHVEAELLLAAFASELWLS
jgi:hypothetical protein